MSQVKFKFMERLGTNLNLANSPIADGDMVNIALGKLQGQITNISTYQFSNSNGVTFGTNAGTVTASVRTDYASSNHSHGNPSLALTNISGTTGSNSNGLTLSLSVNAQTNFVFSNSNNVTFGTNASTVTASASFNQTVQTQNNISGFSAGTTSQNTGNIIFSNSNGISFGLNAGTVTASYTVPSQSVQTQAAGNIAGSGVTTAGNNIGISGTLNSNGLNISATVAAQSVQTQNIIGGFSAGTTSQNSGTVIFSNSNNVSFGLNAGTVTASATFNQTSDTNKAGTTFAGTNVSGTVNSNGINLSVANPGGGGGAAISGGTNSQNTGTVVFSNSNNVTFGLNTNGVMTASVNAGAGGGIAVSAGTNSRSSGTVTFANSNNVSFGMDTNGQITAAGGGALSAGTQLATGGTVVFSNANNVTFGMSSNTITASVAQTYRLIGNTLGNSTVTGNDIYLSGGNNITLSGTSNTIVVQAAAGGGGAASRLAIEINQGERLTTIRQLSETVFSNRPAFFPFWVEGTGIIPRTVRMFVSGGASSNRSLGLTMNMALYSLQNSTQLTLLTSDSIGFQYTASSQSSIWNGIGVLDLTGMSNYTLTAEGRYALAMNMSVSQANASWAQMAIYGCDNYPSFAKVFSNNTTGATNSTNQLLPWQGVYSTTTANFPNSVGKTQIYGGNSNSAMQPYMVLMGY